MLNYYMQEPGMVCSDKLRENEGLTPAQLKQLQGLSNLRGVEIEQLDGNALGHLHSALGLIPDWQFYPRPPPIGTGTYAEATVDLPGVCPSYGICGAMGLGDVVSPFPPPIEDAPSHKLLIAGLIALGIHSALRLPLAVLDGIHGYKRNNEDASSGVVWGILGFLFPLTTTTVAVIEGYGEPA